MNTADLAFDLPGELIAQQAIEPRDAARLLVVPPVGGPLHQHVRDLPGFLRPGDLLVLNHTRVIPARLFARKPSGGEREVLLLHPEALLDPSPGSADRWRAFIRGKVAAGTVLQLLTRDGQADQTITVEALHDDGTRTIAFAPGTDVLALADRCGHIPLPPYIARADTAADRTRYQTVFADAASPAPSVAAPTASLHLTAELLCTLAARGIATARVDLAIGPGTFKPIDTERVEDYAIHAEWCRCPAETVAAIAAAKAAGGRVIAVGTTAVRTLESAAQGGALAPWTGWTRLYCHPPYRMRVVDGLMTNFHLPRSTLLLLVACFTGMERLRSLYAEAITARYRFFSYGDAMLILPERADPPSGR